MNSALSLIAALLCIASISAHGYGGRGRWWHNWHSHWYARNCGSCYGAFDTCTSVYQDAAGVACGTAGIQHASLLSGTALAALTTSCTSYCSRKPLTKFQRCTVSGNAACTPGAPTTCDFSSGTIATDCPEATSTTVKYSLAYDSTSTSLQLQSGTAASLDLFAYYYMTTPISVGIAQQGNIYCLQYTPALNADVTIRALELPASFATNANKDDTIQTIMQQTNIIETKLTSTTTVKANFEVARGESFLIGFVVIPGSTTVVPSSILTSYTVSEGRCV